jgi:23S rRNA pseudouridine1911/1915/1917 synthase
LRFGSPIENISPYNVRLAVSLTLAPEARDSGTRLDLYLQARLPQFSRSRLQEWIRAGNVLVNAKTAKASLLLRGGETIEVTPSEPPPLKAFPEDLPVRVLYQDDAVAAVDKPAGMVVHAGAGVHRGTLVNALLHRFTSLSDLGGPVRPGIVHRLDKETSGVLLVALTDAAHRLLAAQFASRKVDKVYLALVHGAVPREHGRVDSPIERDPLRRTRMTTRPGRGRTAITEYRVLRRFQRFTLLEVRIHTGRTHQIRVHLSSLGHPVAGDRLYGAPPLPGLPGFFLHAHRIGFTSPATGLPVVVESPLPPSLETILQRLL